MSRAGPRAVDADAAMRQGAEGGEGSRGGGGRGGGGPGGGLGVSLGRDFGCAGLGFRSKVRVFDKGL